MIFSNQGLIDLPTVHPNRSAQRQPLASPIQQQQHQSKGHFIDNLVEEGKLLKKSTLSNSGFEMNEQERTGQIKSNMYISIQKSPPNRKSTNFDTSNYNWSSLSASPVKSRRKTTSLTRGVFELPRINSPDFIQSQHENGLPPNLALSQQKDKLDNQLQSIIRETNNTKTAVQDQEKELAKLKEHLAQLRQFQEDKHSQIISQIRKKTSKIDIGTPFNLNESASISPKKKRVKLVIASPQQQQNIVEATALTSSIVITNTALSVQELKEKLRKMKEETTNNEQEIKQIIQIESHTRISQLEKSRIDLFQEVIAQRQALDRNLLFNKIGTLLREHKQEDLFRLYNDRIEILREDKVNLAKQYQQLWIYNQAWINKIERKQGISKQEIKSKLISAQKSPSSATGRISPVKLSSPQASPPQKSLSQASQRPSVAFRPPQTQQQKLQEADNLRSTIKEKEAARALKVAELEKFQQASNQDLAQIQSTNDDLREKVLSFRAQNEKLFRVMRVKTERIIETPASEQEKNDTEAERQRMLKILEDDDTKDLQNMLDGFEFSSMNIEEIHRRLAIYREQQEQTHKHIQSIISDCEITHLQEKSDLPPPLTATFSHTDQVQKTLTLRDLASRHRSDKPTDDSDDFPILQSSKNSKRQLESLHLLLSKSNLATSSDVIQQEQQQQFNQRKDNLQSSHVEVFNKKQQDPKQNKNSLAPSGGSDTGLKDRPKVQNDRSILQVSSQDHEEAQKKMKEEIENLVQLDPNRFKNKNKLNRIMHVQQEKSDSAEKHSQQQNEFDQSQQPPRTLQALSAEQWKSIRNHIDDNSSELPSGVDSQMTPKIISTIREITDENVTENGVSGKNQLDDFLISGNVLSNPKSILEGIMAKFNYASEKQKYQNLIIQNEFKPFPNPALQSRRIENEITSVQADFLKRTLQFDSSHFQGDLRANRTNKSLNNQKYLQSTQSFSDYYIQPSKPDPHGHDFGPYTSTEDFTSHSVEHYTVKKQPGKFEKLIEDQQFLNRFTRNYMMMTSALESSAFKVGEKIPFFASPSLQLYKGTIVSTQQCVSIAKIIIQNKPDLLMHESDTESISRITHPFVQPPIASFIERQSGSNEVTFYRIYSPIKMSLRNYIQKNLSKLSTKDKLVVTLQIAMAVFACHCKKYVLGGIVDLDNISIEEIPNEKRFSISFLQLMSTQHNNEQSQQQNSPKLKKPVNESLVFLSPEAEFNRYLEYRSDVYAIASLLHYLFSQKRVNIVDGDINIVQTIPIGIKRVLQACLFENYRDRINSAGLCIALQQLLDVEDSKALQREIFFAFNSAQSDSKILGQNLEILPFETSAAKANYLQKQSVVYLLNGCYIGKLDKEGKFNSQDAFVFSLDRSTNSIQAIVSDFQSGLYKFAFAFNSKLETLSIHEREGGQIWYSDSKSDDLVKTSNYKGFTIVPNELEIDFLSFLLNKKFKLLDDCGSLLIGGFGQCGLHGVGVKTNTTLKTIALGVFEDNVFVSDGIDYQQSRIYNYIPQKDFKVLDRGMCELSNSFQIGPLNMTQATPSLFLRYTDAADLTAKIIRYTHNFRFEYILLKDLVILCMQRRQNPQKNTSLDSQKVIVVLNAAMQLHSFLPASNASFISDISLPSGNFGIALDIKSEVVYAGLFRKKGLANSPQKNSSLTLEDGFMFSNAGIQFAKQLDLMSKINNMSCI